MHATFLTLLVPITFAARVIPSEEIFDDFTVEMETREIDTAGPTNTDSLHLCGRRCSSPADLIDYCGYERTAKGLVVTAVLVFIACAVVGTMSSS